ncbi:Na(+)/citrate cotransporter-like isoform X4 [Scyliorhinus torazame]|uniref:Na(+)/citrate cotransporter-like isoform X4 n=1 Tax=Scyliorhinus torazame TaxID=75743 RepID=UPI003B5C4D91
MLPCVRHLRNYRQPLLLAAPLLLFLPLPIAVPRSEAYCGFVVLVMAVYWCTEVIPLAVTSFLPILLFPMFGIMESRKVCMQYMKDTNVLFLGGLMVAVAIEHWELHKRIALRALLFVGVKPALLMLGFMGVTSFLSMWISNTATTAMMVPIAKAVLDQLSCTEEEAERLELEKSEEDAAMQIKGSTIDVEAEDESPDEEMKFPEKVANASTVTIEPHNKQEANMYKGLTLCVCYAASIGGTATLTGTGPNLVLKGQFNQIYPENGDVINFASWFGFSFPHMLIVFVLCWLWLQVLFLGVKYVTDATVVLFIAFLMFIIPSQKPNLTPWKRTKTVSSDSMRVRETTEIRKLLNWTTVQHKLPWSVVLLLGGGFALAKGCEVSGLSRWLGLQLLPLRSIPQWGIVVILCLVIAIFTECTSNVATATLFLPILASMATSIHMNPLYVMIPTTLSTSFAFMLPVATPPNAIVFSFGHLKVSDMAKAGCLLNVIGVITVTIAINTWGHAMFDLSTFPEWANTTHATHK